MPSGDANSGAYSASLEGRLSAGAELLRSIEGERTEVQLVSGAWQGVQWGVPLGMAEERDEQLDGRRACNRRQAGPRDGAHLVERAIVERLSQRAGQRSSFIGRTCSEERRDGRFPAHSSPAIVAGVCQSRQALCAGGPKLTWQK